ncbi:hypothetical protein GGR55DRAFT_637501 [Xylaria sp. FL0064]|nr:hypothetical protein GGR55DRAFT_637501 [Xylaria sp. FL0064]
MDPALKSADENMSSLETRDDASLVSYPPFALSNCIFSEDGRNSLTASTPFTTCLKISPKRTLGLSLSRRQRIIFFFRLNMTLLDFTYFGCNAHSTCCRRLCIRTMNRQHQPYSMGYVKRRNIYAQHTFRIDQECRFLIFFHPITHVSPVLHLGGLIHLGFFFWVVVFGIVHYYSVSDD